MGEIKSVGRIGVLMSLYNGDVIKNVKEAVESIFKQTYSDFCLFIYLDGLTDKDIVAYVNQLKDNEKVKIISGLTNRGLAYGLNRLIEAALDEGNYKFFARMDADDISTPDRFATQVDFLINNPDISVVGSNCIEINENGEVLFNKILPQYPDELRNFSFKRSPLIHPSVMFNDKVINDVKYDDNLKNTQDYFLWVDLQAKGYQLYNIQKYLLEFRVANDFYKRRGIGKIKNEIKSRIYAMYKLKGFNLRNVFYLFCLIIMRFSPEFIKKMCYKYLR